MSDTPTPRDVIELAVGAQMESAGTWTDRECADNILSALTAAGYVVEQGWQPIETAPRDGTEVLLRGFWDNPGFPGTGSPFHAVAGWSTFSSSSTTDAQYDWYCGLQPLSHMLVKLTEWRSLPAGPTGAPA